MKHQRLSLSFGVHRTGTVEHRDVPRARELIGLSRVTFVLEPEAHYFGCIYFCAIAAINHVGRSILSNAGFQ
jgi:hypothetical protein